jgi:hypothetical protein
MPNSKDDKFRRLTMIMYFAYFAMVSRSMYCPHSHHQCILHNVTNVTLWKALGHYSQPLIAFGAFMGTHFPKMNLEATRPCLGIRKADMNPSLKLSPDRGV